MGTGEIPRMFSRIAGRYDLANRVLSGTLDRSWRRRLVRLAKPRPGERLLDVGTGTGDLLIEFHRREPALSLWGLDLAGGMLAVCREKLHRLQIEAVLVEGDALQMPFASGAFDIVTIAFGLRNLPDRGRGLEEMVERLRPGGRLLVLEFSLPQRRWVRAPYRFYLNEVVPRVGGWLTGDRPAYEYLCRTIQAFPTPQEIVGSLEGAGLRNVLYEALSGGIAWLYRGDL